MDDVQRAQMRLKFEELFYVQLNILRYTSERRKKYQGYVFKRIGPLFNDFYRDNLPLSLPAHRSVSCMRSVPTSARGVR